jgi:hypothetical protein
MTMTLLAAPAPAHAADPLTVILIGLAIAAVYLLSLAVKPIRSCPRCHGTGAKLSGTGRRTTGRTCRRCHGTGRIRRIGATAVHRFWWSALGDHQRARRRERLGRIISPADHPDPYPGPWPPSERDNP